MPALGAASGSPAPKQIRLFCRIPGRAGVAGPPRVHWRV